MIGGENLLIATLWIAAIVGIAAVMWLLADADEWMRLERRIRESQRPAPPSDDTAWGEVVRLPDDLKTSHVRKVKP